MKKIYITLLVLAAVTTAPLQAQVVCNGLRYHDFVFQDSSVTNIVYGSNTNASGNLTSLKMDVWMPKGDVEMHRPLIVLAHGGNFLGGSKSGTDVLQLSKDLSKMGFVVASIDYRVGMTNFPFPGPDSSDATEAVIRGVHDGRAAVRYFRKDFATNNNSYRIDTSQIYFAGVSAGGFIALHIAYMEQISELPAWADTTNQYGLTGGIEGNSGNPGYASNVKAVINICGALGDSAWIQTGDEPALLLHGNLDGTVPYGSDQIVLLSVYPLLQVDGSSSIHARLDEKGVQNCFETYEGEDHVPHVSNPIYYDTTLVLMRNFLVHYVCGDPMACQYTTAVSIDEQPNLGSVFAIYPNPADGNFTIDLSRLAGTNFTVDLIDSRGALVHSYTGLNSELFDVDENLSAGIYLVRVQGDGFAYIRKVVIQ
jgi:para-nitrobenzyl esterase